jgi:hypothetical protein
MRKYLIEKLKTLRQLFVRRSYYFVFYKCKQYGWKSKEMGGISIGCIESECQIITDKHPIQFQLDCNEKYGKEHETSGGYKAREEYKVVSWIKISKTEYDKYNGWVG